MQLTLNGRGEREKERERERECVRETEREAKVGQREVSRDMDHDLVVGNVAIPVLYIISAAACKPACREIPR